jgi:tape measure domain-containing protein
MSNEAFSLIGTVDVNPSTALTGLKAVERGAEDTASRLDRIGTSIGKGLSRAISIGLGDVGKAVDSLLSITESGLRGIPVVGSAIAATFHEVSGVLVEATSRGYAYNDTLKQQRIQLDLVTGSATETKRELSEISEIAFKTNVGRGFLVDAVQDLQLFNVDGQRALDLVRALSNQATATGGGEGRVASLTDLMERILETGKLDTRTIRQLIKNKVPIYDILVDELKVSQQKAKQLISSGALSGDDLITILTHAFTGPKWTQAAEDMTQTVDGLTQRYNAGVNKLLGVATQPAYNTSIKALNEAVGAVRGPQAGQIAAGAQAAIAPVTALMEQVGSALKSGDIFGGALAAGQSITAGLAKGVKDTASTAIGAVTDLGTAGIGALKDVWQSHSPSQVAATIGGDFVEGLAFGKGGQGGLASEESKEKLRKALEELISDPRVQALIDTIGKGEGTFNPRTGERTYNKMFAGYRFSLGSGEGAFRRTPFFNPKTGKMDISTATGLGQFIHPTWAGVSDALGGLSIGSPHDQELGMVELMRERGMLGPLMRGDVRTAIRRGSGEWASLPGSTSKQPQQKMEGALDVYNSRLGVYQGAGGSAISASNPLPVSIISAPGLPAGAMSAVDPNAPVVAGADSITNSVGAISTSLLLLPKALEPISVEFDKIGDAAEGAGERSAIAVEKISKRVHGLGGELRDIGFTTENMRGIFESSFQDAFSHTQGGFKAMLSTFVIDFAQAVEQMVIKAESAKLSEILFGDGTSGGKKGLLSSIFGAIIHGIAGGASGGGGGGAGGGIHEAGHIGGFAGGGTFVVGGAGGIDSKFVGFMATPGEEVSVRTPAQQRAGSRESHVHHSGYIEMREPPRRPPTTYGVRSGSREIRDALLGMLTRRR